MSETLELPGPGPVQTESRQTHTEPAAAVVDDPGRPAPAPPNTTSDADALAAAQDALARMTHGRDEAARRAQTATTQATRAQTEAAQARDDLARAKTHQVSERRTALASTIQAADSELSRAKAAVKTAGEAGDYEALAEANELIASARYRKDSAAAELATMGDPAQDAARQPQARPAPSQQAEPYVPGPRVQQWLAEHPEMQTQGSAFRAAALSAHNWAIERYDPESDQYFDHINRAVAGFKPQPQPQQQTHTQEPPMPRTEPPGPGASSASQAGPSNRGGGGAMSAGWKPVPTAAGPVNVQDLPGGGMRFHFADPATREVMDEFARICYPGEYQKDPKGALALYAQEQVRITRERATGGVHDLTVGDGATLR